MTKYYTLILFLSSECTPDAHTDASFLMVLLLSRRPGALDHTSGLLYTTASAEEPRILIQGLGGVASDRRSPDSENCFVS